MRSHAAVPHADPLGGDRFRIYFSSRDEHQRSRTFSLVIGLDRPTEVLELRTEPVLDIGPPGAFDDSGAMLSSITPLDDGTQLFYFVGWNVRTTIPFHNAVGVAVVEDGRIKKRFRGPVLDRILEEPYFSASVCVLKSHDRFQCWYSSCTAWEQHTHGMRHRYHIKYAESADGLHWRRDGIVAIDYANPSEYAMAQPTVIRDADRYRMWFSCRGDQYRIGYAESADGIGWQRDDEAVGLAPSDGDWDGRALAYPHVFRHRGSLLLLYNGNEYGRTGFGIAVLDN